MFRNILILITCCFHQKNTFALGIFESVPNHIFTRRNWFPKTHVNYFCSIIHSITDSISHIFVTLITIWNSSYSHDLCNPGCYTVLWFFTVCQSGNNTRDMRPMLSVGTFVMVIPIAFLRIIIIIISDNFFSRIKIKVITFLCLWLEIVDGFFHLIFHIFSHFISRFARRLRITGNLCKNLQRHGFLLCGWFDGCQVFFGQRFIAQQSHHIRNNAVNHGIHLKTLFGFLAFFGKDLFRLHIHCEIVRIFSLVFFIFSRILAFKNGLKFFHNSGNFHIIYINIAIFTAKKIPAVYVVYITVTVIIFTIIRDLIGIFPHIFHQTRMVYFYTTIQNANNNRFWFEAFAF